MLADFLDLNTAVTVNIHIKSIDQAKRLRQSRKQSDLDKMRLEEQLKADRVGTRWMFAKYSAPYVQGNTPLVKKTVAAL